MLKKKSEKFQFGKRILVYADRSEDRTVRILQLYILSFNDIIYVVKIPS